MEKILYRGKLLPLTLCNSLKIINVRFLNYKYEIEVGNLEIISDLELLYREVFLAARDCRFPIYSVKPISHFDWSDEHSCLSNNSSCFNYRPVLGTNNLSDHSLGLAIDFNPLVNPWVTTKFGNLPPGSIYDPENLGTITNGDFVKSMKEIGFEWGGEWDQPDYQHFYYPKLREEYQKRFLEK